MDVPYAAVERGGEEEKKREREGDGIITGVASRDACDVPKNIKVR